MRADFVTGMYGLPPCEIGAANRFAPSASAGGAELPIADSSRA
jgi:hypothetical protein